jgi:hypothetical protein
VELTDVGQRLGQDFSFVAVGDGRVVAGVHGST